MLNYGSPGWRALGQAALVYLAIASSAATAQDSQPGRGTFAEMVAFARLGSVACQRLTHAVAAFRQGLAEADFVENRNVAFEFRWAEGQFERLPSAGTQNMFCARYLSGSSGSAPLVFSARSFACCSSKASEMYFRKFSTAVKPHRGQALLLRGRVVITRARERNGRISN